MSADNFYKSVEKEMKEIDKVYDFQDFISCVSKAGNVYIMKHTDFYNFEKGLSESKVSKSTRPLLSNVYMTKFQRGKTFLYYRLYDDIDESGQFCEANYRIKRTKNMIMKGNNLVKAQTENRGINAKKKETIFKKLSVLIPANKPLFYSTLPENETTVDLVNGRDASEEQ